MYRQAVRQLINELAETEEFFRAGIVAIDHQLPVLRGYPSRNRNVRPGGAGPMSDDSSLHEAGHAAGGREGNVAADCVIDPAMQITRSVSVEVPDRTLNQAIRRYQTAQSRGRDVDFESYLLDYVAVEPEWRTEGGDPVDPEEGLLTRDDSADDCTPTGGVADGGTVECPVCGESVTSTVVLGPDEISVQPCGHRVPARFADKTSDVEDGGQ